MNNLAVIEKEGQRVLTTQQLAEVYETDSKIISNNFNRNKERFIEGKHYFKLEGEELKEFKTNHLNDESWKRINCLYLWTEKGALRHAKILDTDKAWEVYEQLEDTYFRVKEQNIALNQLSPELQMFKQMWDNMAQQELQQKKLMQEVAITREEIASTKQELEEVREVITINPKAEWRKETNNLVSKICRKLNDYQKPKEEIYKALEERGKCKLKIRLNNLQGRALSNGMAPSKVQKLNNLDVIENDIRLKEIYIAIVKEMAIKHGIH